MVYGAAAARRISLQPCAQPACSVLLPHRCFVMSRSRCTEAGRWPKPPLMSLQVGQKKQAASADGQEPGDGRGRRPLHRRSKASQPLLRPMGAHSRRGAGPRFALPARGSPGEPGFTPTCAQGETWKGGRMSEAMAWEEGGSQHPCSVPVHDGERGRRGARRRCSALHRSITDRPPLAPPLSPG